MDHFEYCLILLSTAAVSLCICLLLTIYLSLLCLLYTIAFAAAARQDSEYSRYPDSRSSCYAGFLWRGYLQLSTLVKDGKPCARGGPERAGDAKLFHAVVALAFLAT